MTSNMRAVQREALLSREQFSQLSTTDKILLSNTLAFFQEETRIHRKNVDVVCIPSPSMLHLLHNTPLQKLSA